MQPPTLLCWKVQGVAKNMPLPPCIYATLLTSEFFIWQRARPQPERKSHHLMRFEKNDLPDASSQSLDKFAHCQQLE